MMLSVYRRRQSVIQLSLAAAIGGATAEPDRELLRLTIETGQPVLIGLDGDNIVAKLQAEGDEALSFDALYDTAVTAHDLQRMHRAKVKKPEDVPPQSYLCELHLAIRGLFSVNLLMLATSPGDTHARVRDLLTEDAMFREALFDAVLMQIRQDGALAVQVVGSHVQEDDTILQERGLRWHFPQDE